MGQDLDQAASQIQDLIDQLQKLGMTDDLAREYVSNDLATQAQSNSIVKSKLLTWGQSLGSVAVNEVIKNVVKAVLSLAGIILS
jgi:Asp-tRNA(Asn)/Glu-tRNA(Gln) amidotransferase B subunit